MMVMVMMMGNNVHGNNRDDKNAKEYKKRERKKAHLSGTTITDKDELEGWDCASSDGSLGGHF